ncbi:MAG: 2-C-methyl-D-erythritol 2,4-cyclodiphosphate synthase [Deltaproteobacteria bacterium]|nr:2-C-methyl-D-erythritol 2,4-cyclodiphosphate synthase [Deltaproteobacteria bacterium]MBW2445327.1 2-C-methyl-D-erythritol 2,4-cyclodiphosphate synthase [Deltaproteobacteria bacterium]
MRVGQGIDAHRLEAGRPLVLGGVPIEHDRGLEGHSDGDVLLHAITNALLGAVGRGDLGRHFPSSNHEIEGISSRVILEQVMGWVRDDGYRLANVDATIVAQEPRLGPHTAKIEAMVAATLDVHQAQVNVKVTSTDGLGAIGRAEGISAIAVALIERRERS